MLLTILSPEADTQFYAALAIIGLLLLMKALGAPTNKQEDMWHASKKADQTDIDAYLDTVSKETKGRNYCSNYCCGLSSAVFLYKKIRWINQRTYIYITF